MFGVRDQRKENQQGKSVHPPDRVSGQRSFRITETGKVRNHQNKNQRRDNTGLGGNFPQPDRPLDEPTGGKPADRDGDRHRERRRQSEPAPSEATLAGKQRKPEPRSNMVNRDKRKSAESPENQGVGGAGKRPLRDDLALQKYFKEEIAKAWREGTHTEAGVAFSCRYNAADAAETHPETAQRRADKNRKKNFFQQGGKDHGRSTVNLALCVITQPRSGSADNIDIMAANFRKKMELGIKIHFAPETTFLTNHKISFQTAFLAVLLSFGLVHAAQAQAPVLSISPSTLVFSYAIGSVGARRAGGSCFHHQHYGKRYGNFGNDFIWSRGQTNWLLIPSPSGAPGLSLPASIPVYVVNTSLPAGSYSATVTLTYAGADPSSTTSFGVFLIVTGTGSGGGTFNETITATPSSLAFSYSAGSPVPAPQTLSVTVSDGATFTVNAVTNDGNPWLVASLASTPNTVNVAINPANLSAATYTGTVTLTAPSAITQVSVTLTVTTAAITVSPSQLSFTDPQNYGFGATQTISVTSGVATAISAGAASDNNWLVVDTPTATTPASISVRVNDSTLLQGTYQGIVSIQTSPTTSIVVPVTLTVGPPATLQLAPASLTFSYMIGNPVPGSQTTSVKSLTGSTQIFTVGSSTTDGAAWLMAVPTSPTPGQVTVSINPGSLNAGSYTGIVNVTPATAGASPQPISVSLTVLPAPTPVVKAVLSSASYVGGSVAPGEFVTIFGSALGPASLTTPPAGTYPQSLGGTNVMFDGIPAPILYASAAQTTVQVPYGISIGQTILTVTRTGVTSTPMSIPSIPALPGLFTTSSTGQGQIAALNQDLSLNSSTNPAARGTTIILYGTGEGKTSPASVEGTITPTIQPLPANHLTGVRHLPGLCRDGAVFWRNTGCRGGTAADQRCCSAELAHRLGHSGTGLRQRANDSRRRHSGSQVGSPQV